MGPHRSQAHTKLPQSTTSPVIRVSKSDSRPSMKPTGWPKEYTVWVRTAKGPWNFEGASATTSPLALRMRKPFS